MNTHIKNDIIPRFLRYVQVATTSTRHVEATPSSPGQWELAKMLVRELEDLGLSAALTDHCYVVAALPASAGRQYAPVIGFLAHLDTAEDVSGTGVKPCLVESYDGKRIELARGLALDPASDPDLASHQGKAIIHADGNTLLGADDKAGIAEIMGALAYLVEHPEVEHGPLDIIFSPDEETGKGLAAFPGSLIRARACYTVDGGALGELEAECFNAAEAVVTCTGKTVHPGYARGRMANAAVMAASIAAMLPRSESPESTDGYYGYYYLSAINADSEQASLVVLVRDFARDGLERRLDALRSFAKAVEAQFPSGSVMVKTTYQYFNMKEKLDACPEVLDMLKQASANLGLAYTLKPIRGGTDGATLTEMGIPTPNIFTGGRNWHSRLEWASVEEMVAACSVIIELIRLWADVS
jgi:tripeptide aminopeptidase